MSVQRSRLETFGQLSTGSSSHKSRSIGHDNGFRAGKFVLKSRLTPQLTMLENITQQSTVSKHVDVIILSGILNLF